MEFQIYGKVQELDDAGLLVTMQWLATNYTAKIHGAQAIGAQKVVTFTIMETVYANAVTTLQAMQTQFGAKLEEYNLFMTQ